MNEAPIPRRNPQSHVYEPKSHTRDGLGCKFCGHAQSHRAHAKAITPTIPFPVDAESIVELEAVDANVPEDGTGPDEMMRIGPFYNEDRSDYFYYRIVAPDLLDVAEALHGLADRIAATITEAREVPLR